MQRGSGTSVKMAEIIKGGAKGRTAKVLQWCNDWFMVELDGLPKIVFPTTLRLTAKEAKQVTASRHNGFLFSAYCLRSDGTFSRLATKNVFNRAVRNASA